MGSHGMERHRRCQQACLHAQGQQGALHKPAAAGARADGGCSGWCCRRLAPVQRRRCGRCGPGLGRACLPSRSGSAATNTRCLPWVWRGRHGRRLCRWLPSSCLGLHNSKIQLDASADTALALVAACWAGQLPLGLPWRLAQMAAHAQPGSQPALGRGRSLQCGEPKPVLVGVLAMLYRECIMMCPECTCR